MRPTKAEIAEVKKELAELKSFKELAESITENAKGKTLLKALQAGFAKAKELGGAEKAVIFTESRKTQNYLVKILSQTEHKDKIVLFNGSNNDDKSRQIYQEWLAKYEGTDRVTGSKTSDIRTAIVDYFRKQATILIATEAAAEGINLQFCSLVINYDLPWNPQRIEQRIGRCHRYGQEFDVVVVNFLNKKNAADQRVYQLLSEKFQLFSGVFGASDEVLGSIESGVDFEKRIAQIYQDCRTPEEIEQSFNELQSELETQIDEKMQTTKQKLLEHFDEEVHEKLKVNLQESKEYLSKHENWLWELTKHVLDLYADFSDSDHSFMLNENPFGKERIHRGPYRIGRHVEDVNIYRIGHPLAQNIIKQAKGMDTPPTELVFNYTDHPVSISVIDPLVGKGGMLSVSLLTVDSFETEDYMIMLGLMDDGRVQELDPEQCMRLFSIPATVSGRVGEISGQVALKDLLESARNTIIDSIGAKNTSYFEIELEKLDKWAEDKRKTLKMSIKDLDSQIRDLKKQAKLAPNLPEKLKLQKKVKKLDSKRDEAYMEYKDASKEIEAKKDELIEEIEAKLKQDVKTKTLFTVKWKVI
jgi:superfamily II DNA/RNA helicase